VYEYELITSDDIATIERILNQYGRDGWRVIGVVASTNCLPVWTVERVITTASKEKTS